MIKLSIPHLGGNEKKYVDEAVESTWIVPLGPFVDTFEQRLGAELGADHVVALSSGTAAIHLALISAGVNPGDEVICQSLTFAASANPIVYCGAKPVFVDSEWQTWNMDARLLETAINERIKATGQAPKAIVCVDLYGMPACYEDIMRVAEAYGVAVIEDSAEALGSTYHGRPCGTFGLFGVLSFNGNKIITTSGGGALICPTAESAERAKFMATQAREDMPYYFHKSIGYNYRLSNVSAAIGCAQMDVLTARVAQRRANHSFYRDYFKDSSEVVVHDNPDAAYNSNFWLTTVLFKTVDPEEVRKKLMAQGIETRRIWYPMHRQPVFAECPAYVNGVSDEIFERGLCLPSSSNLSEEELLKVCDCLQAATC